MFIMSISYLISNGLWTMHLIVTEQNWSMFTHFLHNLYTMDVKNWWQAYMGP